MAFIVSNEFLRIVDAMGTVLQILPGFVGRLMLAINGVGMVTIMLVSGDVAHAGDRNV